jgi:glutamate formiminotransferase/formiminotetrahydrofolate cyclodeaminase
MNLSKTFQDYFNELSSDSPTPGGGNVAAVTGALGASLAVMVCNLTIGKKKYADVETEMTGLKEKLLQHRKNFLELAIKDNEAFNKVMSAMKLLKDSDEQKESRTKEIEIATYGAIEVPADVMKSCAEILHLIKTVIEKGNKNSLSDTGVAASLIGSSARSAYLNVLINCESLKNQTIAAEIKKQAEILIGDITTLSEILVKQVIRLVQTQ